MRFLVVGLGSMGKRRIRNLQHLGAGEVVGYDIRPDRNEEATERYGIKTYPTFEDAMSRRPDAVLICTPPDLHVPYAMVAARERIHFLTEASVVDDGYDELIAACRGLPIVAAPSCTMRFHPAVRTIKRLIEEEAVGGIVCFTYHWGYSLPSWHPWEDYHAFYASKRETGGCRETVPFELVWLTWLLGPLDAISCFRGKVSDLDVDIDDVYQLLLRFAGGTLGHLLAEVLSRLPRHEVRFVGETGEILWRFAGGKVQVYSARGDEWREYPDPAPIRQAGYVAPENYYIDEIRHFLAAIEGREPYMYSFEEDKRMLGLLYAAERSSDQAIHVRIAR